MKLFKALISSYIWIGFGAFSSYYYSSVIIPEITFNFSHGMLIWSSTTTLYNILRLFKRELPLFNLVVLGISSLISMYYAVPWLFDGYLFELSIPLFIGLLYGVKIGPLKEGLRGLPFIKIYLIMIVWVYVTTGLFLLIPTPVIQPEHWIFLISQLLFLLAITIPFDIRDLSFDSPNMKTTPQVLGVQKSKVLAILLMTLSGCFGIIYCIESSEKALIFAVLICVIAGVYLISKSRKTNSNLYFAGYVDGLLVLQAISVFVIDLLL